MKKFLAVPVAVATSALTGGLITAPAQAAPAPGASVARAPGDLSPERSHALLEKLEAKLSAGYETKFAATKARLGLQDSDLQKTAEQAINPDLKGAHLRWTRVQQYLETFYDLGDCGFTAEGHHGTPNQRRKAATWGLTLATFTFAPRYIIPTVTFGKLFDKVLPQLVRPDATS